MPILTCRPTRDCFTEPSHRTLPVQLNRGEVPFVLSLQFLTIGPKSMSSAGLHEFSIAEITCRRRMLLWICTVENSAKDVQADVGAGHTALIKTRAAMRQDQSRPRFFGEEFPENLVLRGLFSVSEPPTVLEDPGGFPAGNFAVDIDANVVMVLDDLPAEAALDFNSGTKPRLDLFRFGERGPYALWWVRDMAFEDHFEAIWAFSSHPSRRLHLVHSPVAGDSPITAVPAYSALLAIEGDDLDQIAASVGDFDLHADLLLAQSWGVDSSLRAGPESADMALPRCPPAGQQNG